MAREFLRITGETTWGTYDPSGGPIGSPMIIQLTDSNAFTLRKMPVRWTIRSAGGYNRRVQSGSFKTSVTGALSNLVIYGSQIAQWLAWINPYASGSAFDLRSCTIDHAIVLEDGSNTVFYTRYLGVKVGGWQITSNADASLLRLNLTELVGKTTSTITSTDFPEPAFTDYPSGSPFVHQLASTIYLGATTSPSTPIRTEFDTFQVTGKHLLDPRFFNATTIAYLKYCGRDMDWSISFPFKRSDDRTSLFENTGTGLGVVPVTMNVTYTIPASNTFTMDFKTNSLLGGVADALDYNRLFTQTITGWSQVDSTSASDFSMSST